MHFKKFNHFLIERSGDIFNPKRKKPVTINDPKKYPELAPEFFELIQTAYAPIGGHVKINKPEDVFADPEWNWWQGTDLHGTKDFDIIMFGKKTKFGVKFAGVGHDGETDSKREYIASRGKDLKKLGFYIEVSGKLAEILLKAYNAPIVTDPDEIMKVLGKPVTFHGEDPDGKYSGDGWYTRPIAGHPHMKILLGRPKI